MSRSPRTLIPTLVCAWVLVGCADQPAPEPPPESAAAVPSVPEPTVSWTGSWAPALGGLLIVPADNNTAIVVYPDQPSLELLGAGRIVLLGSAGDTVATGITAHPADSLECGGAPVVRLARDSVAAWAVGLATGISILRSDSIEAMPASDSARMVSNLARLASTITANQETRFNGLPFAVVRASRFTSGDTRIVAAHLVRKLPQEASPLEERTLVVAERPLTRDSLSLRFSQRSEGTEETAEHFEVLFGAVTGGTTLLLVARGNMNGTTYQVLERTAAGAWRVRWSRALRC